jgi:hypothetical protein
MSKEVREDTIAVWFSSGAASAVAAYKTLNKYGMIANVRVVNNPVAEEDEDNLRFLRDVEKWLGVEIEFAENPSYPSHSAVDVWAKRKFMSGVAGAPCTVELKKRARQIWEEENNPDWHVLGFTLEEKQRHDRFVLTERDNVIPVLIDEKMTKADCYMFLADHGIKPPRIYSMGYPNANCIGCVKATSPTYWNHVREMHPDVFDKRAEQSRELGARLVRVNNERIFLDELSPDAKGKPMKNLDFECGLFCEEIK